MALLITFVACCGFSTGLFSGVLICHNEYSGVSPATEPGAASFTVDSLSDLTAVSRLLDCGLLEGLPALARWATVCCHLAAVRSALL